MKSVLRTIPMVVVQCLYYKFFMKLLHYLEVLKFGLNSYRFCAIYHGYHKIVEHKIIVFC